MVKICVFDTETSCLPPYLPGKDWNERNENDMKLLDFSNYYEGSSMWNQMLPLWPSIIQLSYIIYDTDSPNNSKIFNKYIDIPESVVISESATSVHHIDKETIRAQTAEKKALIHHAVLEFMNDIMERDVVAVVGHNIQFDRKMIIAELLRLNNQFRGLNDKLDNQLLFLMDNRKFTCTMEVTTSLCNIKFAVQYKDKVTGENKVFYKIKSPKLVESYEYYFGHSLLHEALHDALVDVILCLRIFMKYNYNEDIYGKNKNITEFINKITIKQHEYNSDVDIENIKLEILEQIDTIYDNSNKKTKRKSKPKSKRFTHRKRQQLLKQLFKKVAQNV